MGVLKVRAGGTWVDVGVGGGPLPPGGVAGDILVKNSATNSDALWDTAMPKLSLTSITTPTLASTTHALTLGTTGGSSMALGPTMIQARAGAAAGTLNLNPLGGNIVLGIGDGTAKVFVGNDAYLQDAQTLHAIQLVSATDSTRGTLKLGAAAIHGLATYYHLTSPSLAYYDANTHYFRSSAGGDYVWINAGGGAAINFPSGQQIGWDGEFRFKASNVMTFQTNSFQVLNSAGNGWKFRSDSNNAFEVWGTTTHHGVCYNDSGVYCGSGEYFRVRGNATGIYWQDVGSGITSNSAYDVATYSNQSFTAKRVAGAWYHEQTVNANPGSTMAGVGFHGGGTAGSIRFQTNMNRFYFNNEAASGFYDLFANAYTLSSTERGKQDMVSLVEALPVMPSLPVATMVRALRPVWYRQREDLAMMSLPPRPLDLPDTEAWNPTDTFLHVCYDEGPGNCGHTPDDPCSRRVNWLRGHLGFIAEEVEQVLPHLTQLGVDMQPDSVNLGSLIGLAYAMLQELDTRLTVLEAA